MLITDLTNTTWYVPSGWQVASGYGQFNVNFTVKANASAYECTVLYLGQRWDSYFGKFVKVSNYFSGSTFASYDNTHNIRFTFTGGIDATNQELISWLEENGIRLKVTDLTNTTWHINNRPLRVNETSSYYSINFTSNGNDYTAFKFVSDTCDRLYYGNTEVYNVNDGWLDSSYSIITINGGYDVKTYNLIVNLSKIGDLILDTKPVYKRISGAWVKQTAYERVNGEWAKISNAE